MKNPINIVCATDDKYVPYCGVMLTSVFENNKDREVTAYIMIDKPLQPTNQRKFARLAKKYRQSIQYLMVDDDFFRKFPLKGAGASYWSVVTYYRMYVQELLPKEVDKVLYLDCDIIVNGSLASLFDQDWTGYAIGGALDVSYNEQEFYDRLGYDPSLGYFNAGVSFINLAYWREYNIGQQCRDYLSNHYDCIYNNDQDVLNYVLREQKKLLPIKYNFQIHILLHYFWDHYDKEFSTEIYNVKKPVIVHYSTPIKPWAISYYGYPYRKLWQKYKWQSPWRWLLPLFPQKRKLFTLIKRCFLWPFGIKLHVPSVIESVSKYCN